MFPSQLQFVDVVLYVMTCVYLCVYEYTQVGIGSPYLVFGVISLFAYSFIPSFHSLICSRVSLCSLGWPGTHYEDQSSPER